MPRPAAGAGSDAGRPPLPAHKAAGLVLAGGRSSRMGRDKAFVEIDGETLLARQIRTLRAAGIERVMVSLRPDLPCPESGVTVVRDREPDLGPLAGIVAGMVQMPDRPILVLAVDMPAVDPPLLAGMLADADPHTGVVPTVSGRWEALCALYPPGILEAAERHLQGAERSPSALVEELAAAGRVRAHPVAEGVATRLRSWNRPGDLPDRAFLTDSGGTTGR